MMRQRRAPLRRIVCVLRVSLLCGSGSAVLWLLHTTASAWIIMVALRARTRKAQN
jgi:hypothetical protein